MSAQVKKSKKYNIWRYNIQTSDIVYVCLNISQRHIHILTLHPIPLLPMREEKPVFEPRECSINMHCTYAHKSFFTIIHPQSQYVNEYSRCLPMREEQMALEPRVQGLLRQALHAREQLRRDLLRACRPRNEKMISIFRKKE